jgi:hypothetical protein
MKKTLIYITLIVMIIPFSNYAQGISFSGYKFLKNDLIRTTDNTLITKDGYGQLYLKIENPTSDELLALKFNVTIEDIFGNRILKLKNVEKQVSIKSGYYGFVEIQAFKDYPDVLASLFQSEKEKENFRKIDDSATLRVIITMKEIIFRNNVNKVEETTSYTLEKK